MRSTRPPRPVTPAYEGHFLTPGTLMAKAHATPVTERGAGLFRSRPARTVYMLRLHRPFLLITIGLLAGLQRRRDPLFL